MTQLLYRDDAYATTFTATVEAAEGNRVRLDRTLFYPEGGGQPSDTGTLSWTQAQARVTEVQKTAGAAWHHLEGDLPPVGATVHGEIDWRTRYRHMQRHSGEHLLAQAFVRINPAFRVAAVSMRSAHCTLDLEGHPGESDARAAEQLLLDVVARELPIHTLEAPESELHRYPLRRPPQVSGTVRLVGVRDGDGWWEMSACGGTHLKSTAFAAPVVVLSLERIKGNLTRVTFMAGEEATEYLADTYRVARSAAQRLSVPLEGLGARLDATLDDAARLRANLERAQSGWATSLAQASSAESLPDGTQLRVVNVPEAALVTPALKALLDLPGTLGVALAPDGRCGAASSTNHHAGKLLQGWLATSGGRGGGKPDLAQGQTSDPAAFTEAVNAWRIALT